MEELDGLSDDVFEMLAFGKIGKALRTGENGTFTRSGYVVKHRRSPSRASSSTTGRRAMRIRQAATSFSATVHVSE